MRQGQGHRALHETRTDVAVDAVERRRGDAHPHLPGAGDGLVDVLVAQDVGVAVLVESNCLHRWCLTLDRMCFEFEALQSTLAVLRSRSKCFESEAT